MSTNSRPKPGAVLQIFDEYGRVREHHSFVCKHCGSPKVTAYNQKIEDISAWCHRCGLICLNCYAAGKVVVQLADGSIEEYSRCIPFEAQLERYEDSHRLRREMGIE